jgi:hypothetical protein
MSDKMRWRYSDMNPVVAAVDAATVIEIGDLVYQDVDDAKPAALLDSQAVLAEKFLGVAMQRSREGDTAPIRVATTGVFEFDCPNGTFELGDMVGADENTATRTVFNQQVAKVGESKLAIGRVAKRQAAATNSVFVDIRSTVMTGGVAGSIA